MEIKKAELTISSPKLSQCPKENKAEVAFIGRSNVGKSSLINMLTGRKTLAKTSATPGKTLLINHFNINDSWYLVDLPGYGFAKRSKKTQEELTKMISSYILYRKADKVGSGRVKMNVNEYLKKLLETWEELPPHFVTSSETQTGKEELLDYIEKIL